MRPAFGPVRDRALHFRDAPRRLCRSSLAPAHQAVALSPFIDNPRRNASSPATPLLTRGCLRSLPCLRLVAPVENRARLGFATLAPRVLALPRRSRVMVSSRAYSSPAPQPASRHSIKPFSIEPIIANIRHSAGFRSHDVRRRRDECQIRHSAVSTSQYRFAIWGRRCGEWPFAFLPRNISRSESGFIANVCYDDEKNLSDARQTGRLCQATFRHILRGTSANPHHKGGESFRGLESDCALRWAASGSGSSASEEFVFCRRKRRIVRNQ